MMPHTILGPRLIVALLITSATWSCGCTTPLFRGQNSDLPDTTDLVPETSVAAKRLVGDLAAPIGTNYLKVEGVALVTNLNGTGSNPPPSQLRDQLMKEMQTHNVRRPEEALASTNTAMVVVRGFIPPGAQKGDVFDVDVRIPPKTETTSLHSGWLMSSRMREIAILDNSVHTGHVAAVAKGAILTDALFNKSPDPVLQTRGRVLAGGVVQLERPIGLVLRDEHTSIKTSSLIGVAINDRFHDFDHGTRKGLANPTRDDYVELKVHSRYRLNVPRYIQVIRNIAVGENPIERLARIAELEKQLLDPTTCPRAAIQLEAIGKDAIATLRKGLASPDPEVRFLSAESLAYMDDVDATQTLCEAARAERAFRWRAMLGLAVLDQYSSREALLELLSSSSAETRYGAFRALRARDARDAVVRGEALNDEFALHVLSTSGEPMIHISRSKRPEIVLFGQGQRLEAPTFLFAGKHILIKHNNEQTVTVKRFEPGGEDQNEVCSTDLAAVIRTIGKVGGGYADVMQAIDEAKTKGFLAARVEIDALPRPGRIYHRQSEPGSLNEDAVEHETAESIPDVFLDRLMRDADKAEADAEDKRQVETDFDIADKASGKRTLMDRMTLWMVE